MVQAAKRAVNAAMSLSKAEDLDFETATALGVIGHMEWLAQAAGELRQRIKKR